MRQPAYLQSKLPPSAWWLPAPAPGLRQQGNHTEASVSVEGFSARPVRVERRDAEPTVARPLGRFQRRASALPTARATPANNRCVVRQQWLGALSAQASACGSEHRGGLMQNGCEASNEGLCCGRAVASDDFGGARWPAADPS